MGRLLDTALLKVTPDSVHKLAIQDNHHLLVTLGNSHHLQVTQGNHHSKLGTPRVTLGNSDHQLVTPHNSLHKLVTQGNNLRQLVTQGNSLHQLVILVKWGAIQDNQHQVPRLNKAALQGSTPPCTRGLLPWMQTTVVPSRLLSCSRR
jgi:hypothetical protein